MRRHRILWHALSSAVVWLACASPVPAQDFSRKPIRIIVSAAAGGATDAVARIVGQKMGIGLRTNVLVENRTGGMFIPALKEVATAEPDGHTLFMAPTSVMVAQLLHPEINYDLLRDFVPVTEVASGPLILVARKDLPIRNVADIIAYDRANPGKLTFGSGGGTGSSFYLALELLKLQTGIRPTHVPYRGAGPALTDLLGGHIDMMFDAMVVMAPQVKEGKVTAIGITGRKRLAALPDVPTMIELGIKDFEVTGWFGLLAPARTPDPVIRTLRDEVARNLTDPDVVMQLSQQGMEPKGTEPAIWGAYLESEFDRWRRVIKEAGIKAE
jgi:tripartite-type tricarboxylate transporter receptor subunit TctC